MTTQPTTAQQDANFATDAENSRQLATTLNAITLEHLQLSEKIGAIKATGFFKKVSTVTEIKLIAEVKETKQYKGLSMIDYEGKSVTCNTFQDFCKALGFSYEKVNQDIQNLSVFGEDFLETSRRMGVGYRELRKLRKIPEEDRQVIINGEAVEAEDKDSLIELIEDMSIKHAKDKDKLTTKVKTLEQEAKAKDRVNADRQSTINQLNSDITAKDEKLAMKLDAPVHERAIDYLEQLETLKGEALSINGKFNALFAQAEQDDELFALIRVNMGHAMLEISSHANDLIDAYRLGDTLNQGIDLDYLALLNEQVEPTEKGADDGFALIGQTPEEVAGEYVEQPEWSKTDK